MAPRLNKVVRLAKRPVGLPKPNEDLVVSVDAIPTPGENQVLVKNLFLSLDPAMRGWMDDVKSYLPPIGLNEIMRGASVGVVEISNSPKFAVGDTVQCGLNIGWAQYGVVKASRLIKINSLKKSDLPLSAWCGVLGGTGLTAYFGLLHIGKPLRGETVVVSAAAGATGSVVAQIAKHVLGCRVVGIAGGREKCLWLTQTLGLDAAIDYKALNPSTMNRELKRCAPDGIDVFFDNVGGFILDAVLRRINFKGRIVLCGAISTYNDAKIDGPSQYRMLTVRSAKMEGFILTNYVSEYDIARADIAKWIAEGKLSFKEDVCFGLENAPEHFLKLFGLHGGNKGKLVVDLHPRRESAM